MNLFILKNLLNLILTGAIRGKQFVVDISESVYVEEDPSKRCRVYPNKEHRSYRECDDQFMKDLVSTFDPPITPIWLTDDLNQVTKLAAIKPSGKLGIINLSKKCSTYLINLLSLLTFLFKQK